MTIRCGVVASLGFLFMTAANAEDGAPIASMDELRFAVPKEKGRAELVDGKVGKAVRFRFDANSPGGLFTSNIHGDPAWDEAEGFSFWVKGNDGGGFGGLEFIYDDDYAVRYDLMFPYRPGEWTKVNVAWSDLIPALPGPKSLPLGGTGGNRPSKLSGLWIGRWWYWGDYPPLDFSMDEIRLEPKVERATSPVPKGEPLARVKAKLKAGKPITIVTMGDSLTDTRHWANREVAWPALLASELKSKFGGEVTIVNPAIGGTQLRQNLVLMPRWLAKYPEPDLVTVFFGGNDWDAGMRGEEFERACQDAVARIRRATGGKADVLLMTTNPAASRWGVTEELAEATRKAAGTVRAGLADTDAAFVLAGKKDPAALFVDDKVHLARKGHELVAKVVAEAVGGR